MAQSPLLSASKRAELDLPDGNIFSKLPTEITLNIFTYLTHNDLFNSTLVCREVPPLFSLRVQLRILTSKKWYYTTSDPILWHNLDLSSLRQPSLTNYAPPTILSSRLATSRSLTFISPTRISTNSVLSLLIHTSPSPYLTSLTLTSISNLRSASPQLCHFFASTRSRSLTHINFSNTAVTTPVIVALLKSHRTTLRTLILDFTEIGDGALRAIATGEKLEKISLSGCFGLSKSALKGFLIRRVPRCVKVLGLRWLLDVRVGWLWEMLSRLGVEKKDDVGGVLGEVDVSGCERLTLAEVKGLEKRWDEVKVVHTAVLVEDSVWGYRKYVEYLTTLQAPDGIPVCDVTGVGEAGMVPEIVGEAC